MKRTYNLMIGERTAEEIKMRLGSAVPLPKELTMDVKGRDMVAGLPKTVKISSEEIRDAMADPVSTIVDAVRTTLERCPPELAADLVDRGMTLAGGGGLLKGLTKAQGGDRFASARCDDPLSAVGGGLAKRSMVIC